MKAIIGENKIRIMASGQQKRNTARVHSNYKITPFQKLVPSGIITIDLQAVDEGDSVGMYLALEADCRVWVSEGDGSEG